MKIDLTELLREVGNEAEVDSTIEGQTISDPEGNLILAQPVKLNLHLINTGDSVLAKGTIETQAEVECSRCLKKVNLPLRVKLDEEFDRNATGIPLKKKGEGELHNADFIYPIEKDKSIDISEIIRQNLMLAIPIKNLCRPDCEGLKGE